MPYSNGTLLIVSFVSFLSAISCSCRRPQEPPTGSHPDEGQRSPQMQMFSNPILPAPSADPWMIFDHGAYYFSESRENGIYIRKSKLIIDCGRDSAIRVWSPPKTGPNCREIWAPELHRIGNRWYLYFAADDGANRNHRMWVAVSNGESAYGPYDSCYQLATGRWAIDGTVFEGSDSRLYFIWSGWPGSMDGQQNLYIAPMKNPIELDTPKVLLTAPAQTWERRAMPICEGPEVIRRNNKTFIIYSASGSWTKDYCLGMLADDGDGDYLKASSWKKTGPVFAGTDSVFGVGHASFVRSPDGSEDWILYHAKEVRADGWDDRSVRAQPFSWNSDGYPDFGNPVSANRIMPIPSHR